MMAVRQVINFNKKNETYKREINIQIVSLLVNYHCDVNIINKYGHIPLLIYMLHTKMI